MEEVDADVLISKIGKRITSWVIEDTLSPALQSQYKDHLQFWSGGLGGSSIYHWGVCMEPPYCLQRFTSFFAQVRATLQFTLHGVVASHLRSLYPVILSNQYTNVPANITLIQAVLNTHMARVCTGPTLDLSVGLVESCAGERFALGTKIAMHEGVEQKLQNIMKA